MSCCMFWAIGEASLTGAAFCCVASFSRVWRVDLADDGDDAGAVKYKIRPVADWREGGELMEATIAGDERAGG